MTVAEGQQNTSILIEWFSATRLLKFEMSSLIFKSLKTKNKRDVITQERVDF
jgi:hypothetical protein